MQNIKGRERDGRNGLRRNLLRQRREERRSYSFLLSEGTELERMFLDVGLHFEHFSGMDVPLERTDSPLFTHTSPIN